MKNIQSGIKHALSEIMKRHNVLNYHQLMHKVYRNPDISKFINKNKDQLSEQDLIRSAPHLYEYVQEKNKLNKGENILLPGYIPRLVINDHSINVTYQPTKRTVELKEQQRLQNHIHSVALPKQDRNASLDDFYYQSDNTRAIIWDAANTFISQYKNNPDKYHRGMYIYGSYGVGKTFLLAAMARRLAKYGFETTLVHFPTFSVEMMASIQNHTTAYKIRSIEQTPILMLDDIGTGRMSSWIRDSVFSIILEYRMQNELPTFFSSNLSMKSFSKSNLSYDTHGDYEPLKAKRIMERVHFLSKEYQMLGPNRRNPSQNN